MSLAYRLIVQDSSTLGTVGGVGLIGRAESATSGILSENEEEDGFVILSRLQRCDRYENMVCPFSVRGRERAKSSLQAAERETM